MIFNVESVWGDINNNYCVICWFRHSWPFMIIPSPASDFQTCQIQIGLLKWTFSGCCVDPDKYPPSVLYDCAKKRQLKPGMVHFLPDAGQGVGGSFRAGGGDLHGSLWGREGVLIWLGMCGESSTLTLYRKTCFNGTLWKEKTFLCSMSRNII